MASDYQTFAMSGSPVFTPRGTPGYFTNRRGQSFGRLACFGVLLVFIAFLLLGPITFIVALIRLRLFPESAPITAPPSIPSERKTFLLNIQPAWVSFPQYGDTCAYWVYTYGGSIPGPSLYVEHGSAFNVDVINSLGPDKTNTTRRENEYRYPNSTTTHFHGLHVSPEGASDNVYAHVAPGKSFQYTVELPEDHPAGTYFVHPHLHGSTALQTGFAMASPLVIRDADAAWRAYPEEVFIIQRGGLDSGHTSDDARLAFAQNEGLIQPVSSMCTVNEFFFINGATGPMKTICDASIRRWRIINAATDGGLVLLFRGSNCVVNLIARDGVYLNEGVPQQVAIGEEVFVVPPGGRIDFLIRVDSSTHIANCQLISSPNPTISAQLGPKTKLMELQVAQCIPHPDPSITMVESFPDTLPALPAYMDDLRNYPKAERRVLEWTEFSKTFKSGKAKYGINGEPFDKHARFSVRLDRVQEWIIVNALAADSGPAVEAHPFHLHTNHFQIVGFAGENPLSTEDYVVGQWRDTVYVPTPGNLTIRWIPRHFTGKSLLHCHILSHEDLGMAWPFQIVEQLALRV